MSAPVPRYGAGALADLAGSVLASLGVPGAAAVLDLPELPRACVLIVDGLGWELLRAHPEEAPFLASLPGGPLTAGFPSTTVTSLGSLGTAATPGEHGLLGVQVAVPGTGRLLNCLRWDGQVEPMEFQPVPTVYERAAADGVRTAYIGSPAFRRSSLTVATARGADYLGAVGLGQLVGRARTALREGDRAFVTVYHSDLDSTGHRFGCGSESWREQLRFVDLLAERLAAALPDGAALHVTADHGMVDPDERLDVDATPALTAGLALLGGDARARYAYAAGGAAADLLDAWREVLGDRCWVAGRDEAIAAGWFGTVGPGMAERIGDVVAVPFTGLALVASEREPWLESMVGMHGSLVPAELLVPLLTAART
ncbi:alkaline phosphatase family protein [Actinomadura parmotrematis]|uniref:Alkaline phosphatase family protein n=1 Tax=Actinomadura parmotrematis TaxID=2864039 RepID=A0ABS7FZJ4_9ACTN|nr:alkaline phosphatase family protein [Actinomadura parmotrematis]MBW8484853.1 alkaline phosphatase family protein [Actinomadura parmotrematis]